MPRPCSSSSCPASVWHGAAAVAQQQVLAQLHFEQPHLAAQRRLRHLQRRRRLGEAAQFRDAHEVAELFQVHRRILDSKGPEMQIFYNC